MTDDPRLEEQKAWKLLARRLIDAGFKELEREVRLGPVNKMADGMRLLREARKRLRQVYGR
jgi:hypothetical protein